MSPSRRVRRRRRQVAVGALVVAAVLVLAIVLQGGHSSPPRQSAPHRHRPAGSPLDPGWRGDGKAVTLAFGGDVHFEADIADRLSTDPATALGPGVPALLAGANVSMADLDSALTDSTTDCPSPPPQQQYPFSTGPQALTALRAAGLSVVTQANNHALDCGATALPLGLAAARSAGFPVVGIGEDAAQAYAPYVATVAGQRIAFIGATQVLDPSFQSSWAATASSPGVASAFDPGALISAVEDARAHADTVVVYLHWGRQAQSCPDPIQGPLAEELVKAGADIVVGANAHVPEGAGYLGRALVDYGLGNLAFYDDQAPETDSGVLLVTVTGRHIDAFRWRPATLQGEIPVPLSAKSASAAVAQWQALRHCARLAATAAPVPTRAKDVAALTRAEERLPPPATLHALSLDPGYP